MTQFPTDQCQRCHHQRREHRKEQSNNKVVYACVQTILGFTICPCPNFIEQSDTTFKGETNMAGKRIKKESAGRTPTLAPYVKDGAFSIYAKFHGKEKEARVHADGTIHIGEKVFTSLSDAGKVAAQGMSVNGWIFWKFKKNGELVPLDVLRGGKSPLKAKPASAPKKAKAAPKKAVKVKAKPVVTAAAPKAKAARKPKAAPKAPAINGQEESSDTGVVEPPIVGEEMGEAPADTESHADALNY